MSNQLEVSLISRILDEVIYEVSRSKSITICRNSLNGTFVPLKQIRNRWPDGGEYLCQIFIPTLSRNVIPLLALFQFTESNLETTLISVFGNAEYSYTKTLMGDFYTDSMTYST